MLDFKPITKELLIREGRSLRRSRIQICDYTPGCLYIWRHYYHMRCAEADGMFIFESGDGSGLYYNCPVGTGDFDGVRLTVLSEGEFVEAGERVKVTRVEGNRIYVRRV